MVAIGYNGENSERVASLKYLECIFGVGRAIETQTAHAGHQVCRRCMRVHRTAVHRNLEGLLKPSSREHKLRQ